jgi:phospholipid/cholesterol/gamma-HCH transport system substrate-binding protein
MKPSRAEHFRPGRMFRPSLRGRGPSPGRVAGLAVLVVLLLVALNAVDLPIIGGGTRYTAYFTEAAGLRSDDEVRIAGVLVGRVRDVSLDGDKVKVEFRVRDAWVGDESGIYIKIKSVLGQKYLTIDPLGTRPQDPHQTIPLQRTASPYDVLEAFRDLAQTTNAIDTEQLATGLRALSDSVRDSPTEVREALTGLSRLSETISKRDTELMTLLGNARDVSGLLAARTGEIERLIADGNLLLAELQARRNAISRLLDATVALSAQLRWLVQDNADQLKPALEQVEKVTDLLLRNQQKLSEGLYLMGPVIRLVTPAIGNGRWFDSYVYGVLPPVVGTVSLLPEGR